MGRFKTEAALQLAGIGGGAALNAYLGKKAAEKYGLSPEEKRKLLIRRGLKGAAIGAIGSTLATAPITGIKSAKAIMSGDDSIFTENPSLIENIAKYGRRTALVGGLAGHFYGQDVKNKIKYAKDSENYKGFNPETGKYETKGQARLFADGGGLAGFGAKALNWWNKRSDAQKGAIIGGVAGAGIGAAKKGVKGALVGAGVGAGAGALGGMAYKKWGNGALKNTFGGVSTSSTNTTRPTRTSTSPSTGSNHNRTAAVNFDPRTKTQSNLVKNVFKGGSAIAGGMYGAGAGALLGAGIGAARGGWKGALKGAGIGAVAGGAGGAGLGYYGGSKASEHTTKTVKDMMDKVKKHSNYLPVVRKQTNYIPVIGTALGAGTGILAGNKYDKANSDPNNPNQTFWDKNKGKILMGLSGGASGYFLSKAIDNKLKERSLDKVRKAINKDYYSSKENPEFFRNTVENLKPGYGKKAVMAAYPDLNNLPEGEDFKNHLSTLNDYLERKAIYHNNSANKNLIYSNLGNLGLLGSVSYLRNTEKNKEISKK